MAIISTTMVRHGSWRHPIFTASSRRMYEPGFMALRLPWLRPLLRRVNAGPLFMVFGMLPIENELNSREIARFAWAVQQRHGPLLLSDIFDQRVAERFAARTKSSDLWGRKYFLPSREIVKVTALREPYRREILEETRASIGQDLARLEDIVRRGGTVYLTPEGKYSIDGRMRPMRGLVERLAPLATIYLAGVSYDPFVSERFSMLYRIVRSPVVSLETGRIDESPMKKTLAAIRPVVTSQLLGAWLASSDLGNGAVAFTAEDACAAVETRMANLPPALFVDPELQRAPRRMVRAALPRMVKWRILEREGDRYRLAPQRRHPQFPFVEDIIEYQSCFLQETLENAPYAQGVSDH
jgi:hypothetical protein